MSKWMPWRGPAIFFALAALLMVSGLTSLMAAGDANKASDGQATASALARAAAGMELAWEQAIRADALAATGADPAGAQALFAGATTLYNSSKAVLSAAGVEQINQAIAGSDQAFAGLSQSFAGTIALAASQGVEVAAGNHVNNSLGAYTAVRPAIEGLKTIGGVADNRLQSSLDSGASTLRWFSVFMIVFAAAGLAWAAYSGWTVYRVKPQGAVAEQPVQLRKAA